MVKGAEEVVLENRHLRARLHPKTGRLTSLLLKDNTGAGQKGGSRRMRRVTVTVVLCHVCRWWRGEGDDRPAADHRDRRQQHG